MNMYVCVCVCTRGTDDKLLITHTKCYQELTYRHRELKHKVSSVAVAMAFEGSLTVASDL